MFGFKIVSSNYLYWLQNNVIHNEWRKRYIELEKDYRELQRMLDSAVAQYPELKKQFENAKRHFQFHSIRNQRTVSDEQIQSARKIAWY